MPVINEDYRNSICEIKSMQNDLLATGRIYSVTDDNIEFVHPEDDRMPLLPYNTRVKISIFNAKLGFKMLAGVVFISTDVFLRVSNITTLQDSERRMFFRMRVQIPSRAYPIDNENAGEPVSPIMVQIEDISLSGVQVSTPLMLERNSIFALEIQLFKKKMMFHCRVVRMSKSINGTHYYGCSFFDQSERQSDDLCYDLFQLQRMEIRKKRNNV